MPAAGVSDRVLEALGRIVGVSMARLREAGRSAGEMPPGRSRRGAFARVGAPDPQYAEAEDLMPAAPPDQPRDSIDELFTGASARDRDGDIPGIPAGRNPCASSSMRCTSATTGSPATDRERLFPGAVGTLSSSRTLGI